MDRSLHRQACVARSQRRRQCAASRRAARTHHEAASYHEGCVLVLLATIADNRQQAPSTTIPAASESLLHASRFFSSSNPSRHVRLCRNWLPTSGGCASQCARDRQGNMALCRMGYGPCDARRSEASAGAARALLVPALALALRVTSTAANTGWLSGMLLRDSVAAAVRCAALQPSFIHRVQAAAAAHVAHRPDILQSAAIGDHALVLCHLIADADGIERRSENDSKTPLHRSAAGGHLETCRLLLQSNADPNAQDDT